MTKRASHVITAAELGPRGKFVGDELIASGSSGTVVYLWNGMRWVLRKRFSVRVYGRLKHKHHFVERDLGEVYAIDRAHALRQIRAQNHQLVQELGFRRYIAIEVGS